MTPNWYKSTSKSSRQYKHSTMFVINLNLFRRIGELGYRLFLMLQSRMWYVLQCQLDSTWFKLALHTWPPRFPTDAHTMQGSQPSREQLQGATSFVEMVNSPSSEEILSQWTVLWKAETHNPSCARLGSLLHLNSIYTTKGYFQLSSSTRLLEEFCWH